MNSSFAARLSSFIMKKIRFLLITLCLLPVISVIANDVSKDIPSFKEDEVKSRLERLDQFIIHIDIEDQVTQNYIRNYVIKNRKNAERILGRTATFFPLFEQKISDYNLPPELKFLAVVESALNPQAISSAGAGGLWQFMPGTGKEFGLKIDANVDERMDPVKSTEAAMKYLTMLFDRFGDWALALAAYNSGPGRVNYAIKRSKSTDFWTLKKYLPRETRNYVPAFVAAIYLFQYQEDHNLQGESKKIDLQVTDNVQIKSFVSFYRLAQITGVSLATIRQLNPGYRKDFIPENKGGSYVILPARVCPSLRHYLSTSEGGRFTQYTAPVFLKKDLKNDRYYNYSIYQLSEGETLSSFAKNIGCSVSQLMAWNEGLNYFQNTRREVRVYRSNTWISEQPKPVKTAAVSTLPTLRTFKVTNSMAFSRDLGN